MAATIDAGDRRPALAQALSGALVFTIAGTSWGAYGGFSLRHAAGWWPLAGSIAAGLAVLAAWWTTRARLAGLGASEAPRDARAGRWFSIINAAQGVAILVAVNVCNHLHAAEYFPMAFALIVGLHFVALAPVFRSRFHAILGALMCLVPLCVVLALPRYTASVAPGAPPTFVWACVIGMGNAALLWGAALVRLRGVHAGIDSAGDRHASSPHG